MKMVRKFGKTAIRLKNNILRVLLSDFLTFWMIERPKFEIVEFYVIFWYNKYKFYSVKTNFGISFGIFS